MQTKPILNFESVTYVRNKSTILNNVSFSLNENDSLVILGRNGAGKTTLINLLFGYYWPTSGSISVFGETYGDSPMAPIQNQIGIVQSNHQETLLQRLTTIEMVVTGLIGTLGLYKEISEPQMEEAYSLLSQIGMESKKDQPFQTLSSGEKMKVLLLRAMGKGKRLLILDEPAAALDLTARVDFFLSCESMKSKDPNLTRILITHRLDEIPESFQKLLLLKEGKILAFGDKKKVLTSENLSNLYDLPLALQEQNGQYSVSVSK